MQVGSSCFFCTAIRLVSHPGDGLLPSPVFCSKITAVTFRRRFNSYIVWINEASLLRHEITFILAARFPFSQSAVYLSLVGIVPSGFLSFL